MKPKIVIALNTAWNLFNFRSGLIKALLEAGYEVVAVAPEDEYADKVKSLGCRFVALPMDNRGTNPVRDLALLCRFYRLLRRARPAVFLGYTVKPNVYGSIAAHSLGIPVVNNIAGLGAVFIKDSWVTRVVRKLYRWALGRSAKVFFQNQDDRDLFVSSQLVERSATDLLPGSGINLSKFSYTPLPVDGLRRETRFLLIARMLWDKGVGEFVEAARILKQKHADTRFCLLGFLDVENPSAISRSHVEGWVKEGIVDYLGVTDDIRPFIADADCVVLPSYREGTPRTLLEAAAMGRPIVTTNAVGCREVVDDGENGFLCTPRSAEDLAEKMERFLLLDSAARKEMGLKGRRKMEDEFDESIVIKKYLVTVNHLCPPLTCSPATVMER